MARWVCTLFLLEMPVSVAAYSKYPPADGQRFGWPDGGRSFGWRERSGSAAQVLGLVDPGLALGFVGAAESKALLAADSFSIPFVTVTGRRGGSAIASAAFNAISKEAWA